jgi:hypothetical protein
VGAKWERSGSEVGAKWRRTQDCSESRVKVDTACEAESGESLGVHCGVVSGIELEYTTLYSRSPACEHIPPLDAERIGPRASKLASLNTPACTAL